MSINTKAGPISSRTLTLLHTDVPVHKCLCANKFLYTNVSNLFTDVVHTSLYASVVLPYVSYNCEQVIVSKKWDFATDNLYGNLCHYLGIRSVLQNNSKIYGSRDFKPGIQDLDSIPE